jgi:hypothetical protein
MSFTCWKTRILIDNRVALLLAQEKSMLSWNYGYLATEGFIFMDLLHRSDTIVKIRWDLDQSFIRLEMRIQVPMITRTIERTMMDTALSLNDEWMSSETRSHRKDSLLMDNT